MTDWAAVQADDFAVPEDRPLAELVDELCAMLAARAPEVRDGTAYPILALWTARGVLDGRLAALGDRMAERLRHEEIQARTFAPMILAWVVLRDVRTQELAAECVPASPDPRRCGRRTRCGRWALYLCSRSGVCVGTTRKPVTRCRCPTRVL